MKLFEFGPVVQEEMPLKGVFLIWSSGSPFVQWSVTMYQEEQFCEIILSLGQWFRRCRLKDFLSGALAPSCSVEHNHLCNFERRHHGEHSCEIT